LLKNSNDTFTVFNRVTIKWVGTVDASVKITQGMLKVNLEWDAGLVSLIDTWILLETTAIFNRSQS